MIVVLGNSGVGQRVITFQTTNNNDWMQFIQALFKLFSRAL
jgi:hypothetical protein